MGYEYKTRIRYSECGPDMRLSLDRLADHFQDCMVFHDKAVGFGMDYWMERKAMWVTTSWKILIFRLPSCYEEVTVRTDAIRCHGFKGDRNFTLRDGEGRLLAAAYARYALIDLNTGRPTRIDPEEGGRYGENEPLLIREEKGHITVPEEASEGEPIRIASYHLDSNRHVNNTQYIRLMADLLPEDFTVKAMRVSYHKSAVMGDILIPRYYRDGHQISAVITNEAGDPCVFFRFDGCLSEEDSLVESL